VGIARLDARKYGENTVRSGNVGRAETHRDAVMVVTEADFRYGIFG
jgi:hypothetical protein